MEAESILLLAAFFSVTLPVSTNKPKNVEFSDCGSHKACMIFNTPVDIVNDSANVSLPRSF